MRESSFALSSATARLLIRWVSCWIPGRKVLVIDMKDEASQRYIRGLTVGVALCDEISLMPPSFFQMLLTPHGARLCYDKPGQPLCTVRLVEYLFHSFVIEDSRMRAFVPSEFEAAGKAERQPKPSPTNGHF